ncbi:MAG: spore coat protein [Desulfotomaculaceae bacterium]|nr:spore coat protein [Desulfotomaculaceae bacterium]
MANLLQNMLGNTDGIKINDQVIANDALMGMKGASAAYLGATLESATPEVRRMYSEFLTQCVLAHEGMTALAVKKGWYKPYLTPQEQITEAYKQSEWILGVNA